MKNRIFVLLVLLVIALTSCENKVDYNARATTYSPQPIKVIVVKCNKDALSGVYVLKVKSLRDSVAHFTSSFNEYEAGDIIEVSKSQLR